MTGRRSAAVTIVGSNYLARAHVLHSSVRRWHPEWHFVTIVVDGADDDIDHADVGEVWAPEDLGIAPIDLAVMGFLYNVTEFCTSIKPFALLRLLDLGYDQVMYLDPDTRLYGRAEEIGQLLESHDVVLTPHTLTPLPDDGMDPTVDNIRSSGSFNLGFFAGASGSRTLLEWWARTLVLGAGIEIELNRFTDQRWMDLAPSYADVGVLRHRGYNVAYWNLHERNLADGPEGVTTDGQPLVLFHFSGYEPEAPWQLSKYTRRRPRVRLVDSQVLYRLCDEYRTDLLAWADRSDRKQLTRRLYIRNQLPLLSAPADPIRSGLRTMLRDEQVAGLDPLRGRSDSPPGEVLQNWLLSPPVDAPATGLPRLLWAAWNSRVDLRERYPDPHGLSRTAVFRWAGTAGFEEEGLPTDIAELVARNTRPAEGDGGLTVVGYLENRFGAGDVGRRLVRALRGAGLDPKEVSCLRTSADRAPQVDPVSSDRVGGGTTLWCVDGDDLRDVQRGLPEIAASSLANVVYWCAERDPDPLGRPITEIWAPSRFVHEHLTPPSGVVVHLAPPLIDPCPDCSSLTREDLGLAADSVVFLTRLDFLDSAARQNTVGVVAAFRMAFPVAGRAQLVVRTRHGSLQPQALDKLAWSVHDRPDIRVWDGTASEADDNALTRAGDCFVSLHRAVAFGPDIADAMALGRATIATAYSGNLDFCTPETTHLVPARTVALSDPDGFYLAEGEWAEPDLGVAARAMASVAADPAQASTMGAAARTRIAQLSEPRAFETFVRMRLDVFGATRPLMTTPDMAQPSSTLDGYPSSARSGSGDMPVRLPPVESVLGYGRNDAGRLRRLIRRCVFSLTKNNLYYSRSLVESALQQLGVDLAPTHRIVGSAEPGPVTPQGSRPLGTDGGPSTEAGVAP